MFMQGTVSSDKQEILFSRYHINYNNEPEIFKKGSVVYRNVGLHVSVSLADQDYTYMNSMS